MVERDWKEVACRLWMLLDDIDTVSDVAKGDNAEYRRLTVEIHSLRFSILPGEELDRWHAENARTETGA